MAFAPQASAARRRVRRFTVSERALHWIVATMFFSLLASGAALAGLLPLSGLQSVAYVWHLASGGGLAVGLIGLVFLGDRRTLARTLRDLREFDAGDRRWLRAVARPLLGGPRIPPAGRFNAGQKVNYLLVAGLLAVLVLSGLATVIAGKRVLVFGAHQVATIVIACVVAGHLYMALVNRGTRPALRGILTGEVDREWAEQHHPRWTPSGDLADPKRPQP